MAKVSVSIPDDVVAAAKAAGLNISGVATAALSAELEKRAKIAALDSYLAQLEQELGPIPQAEAAEAREWADRVASRGSDLDEARRSA